MFGKTAIIYLSKNKLWTVVEGKEADTYELDWDGINLTESFQKIKTELKVNRIRIITSAEVSYNLTLKNFQETDREKILEEAKKYIPEDLDDHSFDWKQTSDHLELVAISPFLLNTISYAANSTKISLDTILPAATVLAQAIDFEKPHLILWKGPENLAVIAHQHTAYFAQSSDKDLDITKLLSYAKEKFSLDIVDLIHDLPDSLLPKIPTNVNVKSQPLNPMMLLKNAKAPVGKDKDILAITPIQNATKTIQPISKTPETIQKPTEDNGTQNQSESIDSPIPSTPPKPSKVVPMVIVIILLLAALVVGGFYVSSNFTSFSIVPTPTPTPMPTPIPTPTPLPINLSDYSVQILNGSGTPGEAAAVQEILAPQGFEDFELGNASRYDYEDTQISLKPNVPKEVYEKISTVLSEKFTPVQAEDALTESSEYDVLIVIGSRK